MGLAIATGAAFGAKLDGDGVMVEHAVPEGSDVRVGDLVCVVETDGAPG